MTGAEREIQNGEGSQHQPNMTCGIASEVAGDAATKYNRASSKFSLDQQAFAGRKPNMRYFILTPLMLLALGCSEPNSSKQPTLQPTPQPAYNVDIDSQEPHFVWKAPPGFKWDEEFARWYNEDVTIVISQVHRPGESFSLVVGDFTEERMLASKLEMISKETQDIDGRPTLVLYGNKLNGEIPKQFFTVVYGTDTGVAQLTGMYPTDSAEDVKAQVQTALLSSRYIIPAGR